MRVENMETNSLQNAINLFENRHGIKLDEREIIIFCSAYNLGRMSAFKEKAQAEHPARQVEAECDELREKLRLAEEALYRDKTGLAKALEDVVKEVDGRRWLCEGRGPYKYDDERYRQEAGWAFDAIHKIAYDALVASGKLADKALAAIRGGQPETAINDMVHLQTEGE